MSRNGNYRLILGETSLEEGERKGCREGAGDEF